MIRAGRPLPTMSLNKRPSGATLFAAVALAWVGLALPGAARGEGTPAAPPPAESASKPMPALTASPAVMMAAMARELDKQPGQAVLVLQTITITQGEMADVIRAMPASAANLGFAVVSRRALDVLIAQKTLVLNALKEGVDKDPAFIRGLNVLRDKALADIWLARKADLAVTDQALHARYDRDVAGKPNPDEVRARVIVVPTIEEARLVIGKAQSGADFAELARGYSTDGTASRGGDLGYVTLEAVTPEIGHIAFALNPGQITAFPTRTSAGYLVLRVESRRQRGTPSFDEARPGLETALRAEATRAAIDDVMSHVTIAKPADLSKK
jgi:peptidyl-prolyl cis-trans isomerase C